MAQEAAALWAFWIAVFTLIQLGISGLGIWAILRTLKQGQLAIQTAREANQIQADAARRQSKPFLYIDRIEGKWRDGEWCATVFVKNAGSTPAFNIRAAFRIWDSWGTADSLGSWDNVDMKVCPHNGVRRAFPRIKMSRQTLNQILDGENAIFITTTFTYDSYFAKDVIFSETKGSRGADFANHLYYIADVTPPDPDDLVDRMGADDDAYLWEGDDMPDGKDAYESNDG